MKSEVFRSEKLGTLTSEYEQAAVDLREMREGLQDEREDLRVLPQEDRLLGLEEARAEHTRLQTWNADFEQR